MGKNHVVTSHAIQSTAAIRDRTVSQALYSETVLSTAVRRRFPLTEMLFTHDRFLSTVIVNKNR